MKQRINETTNQLLNESINQSVNPLIADPMNQRVNASMTASPHLSDGIIKEITKP